MTTITTGTQFGARFEGHEGVMWFSTLGGLRGACWLGCTNPEYRRPVAVYVRTVVTRVEIQDAGELDAEWIDRLTGPREES